MTVNDRSSLYANAILILPVYKCIDTHIFTHFNFNMDLILVFHSFLVHVRFMFCAFINKQSIICKFLYF